ncbi:hypothetical protein BJY16_007381 [Actinoplanes octamycinicus]|uniref:Uncharacterized protein n=1 Tax=Actinoplanes octamycinicus TaxID=135948 RepID=A0A7W7H4X4_9ACTN|nr:hypothetical protein [Actinoplanes octamycinicus]MBB4743922.1 hypothetical protein [Actinoplanes octamycinicus]
MNIAEGLNFTAPNANNRLKRLVAARILIRQQRVAEYEVSIGEHWSAFHQLVPTSSFPTRLLPNQGPKTAAPREEHTGYQYNSYQAGLPHMAAG